MLSSSDLIETFQAAGLSVREYSGRGMNGAYCVAFKLSADESLPGAVAEVLAEVDDASGRRELADVLSGAAQDDLGKGTIVYFPRFKWPQ